MSDADDLSDCRFTTKCDSGILRVEIETPHRRDLALQTYNGPLALTYAMSWCAFTLANFVEGAGIGDAELIASLRFLASGLHDLAKSDEKERN